jgi:hypothetical protein
MKAENWDVDPAQNTQAPPVGDPEGQLPSTVNDSQRYSKANSRELYDWLEALDAATAVGHNEETNAIAGVNDVHPVATVTDDGFLSAVDKVILDGLSAVGAPVTSVFAREGDILANVGDYTASQITNVPNGSIIATSVQTAIDELEAEKAGQTDTQSALALKLDKSYNLTAGAGISGGGTFESALTLAMAIQEFSVAGINPADLFAFVRDGDTAHFKLTLATLKALINAPDFEVIDASVNAGANSDFPHGLGVTPRRIEAYLLFTAATKGFAIGDVVSVSSMSHVWRNDVDGGPTDLWGLYVYVSSTNISYVVGEDGIQMVRYPDGSSAINAQGINLGAVDVILRAWI